MSVILSIEVLAHTYNMYKVNLQTELFCPLTARQCSSEWFENWDMSIAQ